MRVGVLGTGDVGKALARGFVSRGHEVKVGSRDPGKAQAGGRKADASLDAEAWVGGYPKPAAIDAAWRS